MDKVKVFKNLAVIESLLYLMTQEERRMFFEEITASFCLHCGSDSKICYCQDDS